MDYELPKVNYLCLKQANYYTVYLGTPSVIFAHPKADGGQNSENDE